MKINSLLIVCLATALLQTNFLTAQIKWDFDQGTGTASPVSATIPANMAVSDMVFGNPNGAVTMVTNTSPSPTTANANYTIAGSGNYNATVAVVSGGFSANSTYFTCTLTPATGYSILLTGIQFGTRSIGAGPNAYQIFTSADNFTTSVAGGALSNNSTWYYRTPTITAVNAGIDQPLTIRVYGYSAVNPVASSANWRIDDVYINASVSTITPVTLADFTAVINTNNRTVLSWKTAQEHNCSNFKVEKSADGNNYTAIATINAQNIPGGSAYTAIDDAPVAGQLYYRLKITDKDGAFRYSKILTVNTALSKLTAYPNPAASGLLTLAHPRALPNTIISIIDITGATVATVRVMPQAVTTGIDISRLKAGNYRLVYSGKDKQLVTPFIKQ